MTPTELEQLALQQTQGDVWKALRLLAEEVCAQMQTGFYRPEPRHPVKEINLGPKAL